MSNIINLNRFRKTKKRSEEVQTAAENRSKFGRTKSAKTKETSEAEETARRLDGHKCEDDER